MQSILIEVKRKKEGRRVRNKERKRVGERGRKMSKTATQKTTNHYQDS